MTQKAKNDVIGSFYYVKVECQYQAAPSHPPHWMWVHLSRCLSFSEKNGGKSGGWISKKWYLVKSARIKSKNAKTQFWTENLIIVKTGNKTVWKLRLWSVLEIIEQKSSRITSDRPYSLNRPPKSLFSHSFISSFEGIINFQTKLKVTIPYSNQIFPRFLCRKNLYSKKLYQKSSLGKVEHKVIIERGLGTYILYCFKEKSNFEFIFNKSRKQR